MEQQTHAAALLDAAAVVLEQRGRSRRDYCEFTTTNRCCVKGALQIALRGEYELLWWTEQQPPEFDQALFALLPAIGCEPISGESASQQCAAIDTWNNNEDDDAVVTSTMRAVAATLRAAASESVPPILAAAKA